MKNETYWFNVSVVNRETEIKQQTLVSQWK